MRSSKLFWIAVGGFVVAWGVMMLVLLQSNPEAPIGVGAAGPSSASGAAAPELARGLPTGAAPLSAPLTQTQPITAATAASPAATTAEPYDDFSPPDEYAEQREQIDRGNRLLRSPDPDERIEGVGALVDAEPQAAAPVLDGLLRGGEPDEDLRVEAFEKLEDLKEGEQKVDFLIRSLRDRSPKVREQAAWQLSFEDEDLYPKLVPALYGAFASERDSEAKNSIQSALEDKDPNFVDPDEPPPLLDDQEIDAMASVTAQPR